VLAFRTVTYCTENEETPGNETTEVHSVAPVMHPSVAVRLMVDHHLTSLPVVEDGKVIGVISRIDLLSLLKELENPLKRGN